MAPKLDNASTLTSMFQIILMAPELDSATMPKLTNIAPETGTSSSTLS
jgi:hypothetical protein